MAVTTAELFIQNGEFRGMRRAFAGEITVGRHPECGLALNDEAVSRKHLRISIEEKSATFEDLGSRSGTHVNGEPRASGPLYHGDELTLGGTRMMFLYHSAKRATDTGVELVTGEFPVGSLNLPRASAAAKRTDVEALLAKAARRDTADAEPEQAQVIKILRMARRLSQQPTTADVLSTLEQTLPDALPMRRFVAFDYDARAHRVQPAVYRKGHEDAKGHRIQVRSRVVLDCCRSGEPATMACGEGQALIVPIDGGNGVKGALYVEIDQDAHVGGTLDVLRAVGHDVALALERCEQEAHIRQQNQRLQTLTKLLTESEARLRKSFDQSVLGMYRASANGRIDDANVALLETLGFSSLEALVREQAERPLRMSRCNEFHEALERDGELRNWESTWRRADGREVHLRENVVALCDEAGERCGFEACVEDVTARHQAETERAHADRRYQRVVDNIIDALIVDDVDGRVVYSNRAFRDLFGVSTEAMGEVFIDDYVAPDWRAELRARHDRRIRGEETEEQFEYEGQRLDGTRMRLEARVTPVIEDGRVVGTQSAIRDITKRSNAERTLHATLEQLRVAVHRHQIQYEHNPLPMFVYDRSTLKFVDVNPAALAHYGYSREETLAMRISDLLSPEDAARLEEILPPQGAGFHVTRVVRHVRKDGSLIDVEVIGNPLPGSRELRLVMVRDLTQQLEAERLAREREDEVRQLQKMDAMGQLAGGIAHDFNNILTAILGYGQLGQRLVEPSSEASKLLGDVVTAAQRAAQLTRQLLTFSRKQVNQPRPLGVDGLIRSMEGMLSRLVSDDISLVLALGSEGGTVLADLGQFHQIMLNLIVNASDAMPNGGRVQIQTRREGRDVVVSVSDTGVGMSDEVRDRVFEPFYTTKQPDRGTGLGLSTVYGIVRQSEGRIEVESELGRGTSFHVWLPHVDDSTVRKDEVPDRIPLARGSEAILVVEDDDMVRRMVQSALEVAGYQVVAVPHGEAALALLEEDSARFALIVSDVVMPGISGPEMVDRVLKLVRPPPRILFMSGHIHTDRGLDKVRDQPFIQKPFLPDELARVVRGLFDS